MCYTSTCRIIYMFGKTIIIITFWTSTKIKPLIHINLNIIIIIKINCFTLLMADKYEFGIALLYVCILHERSCTNEKFKFLNQMSFSCHMFTINNCYSVSLLFHFLSNRLMQFLMLTLYKSLHVLYIYSQFVCCQNTC